MVNEGHYTSIPLKTQAQLLFTRCWTENVDDLCIRCLARENKLGNFRVGEPYTPVIESLHGKILAEFGLGFTCERIEQRIHFLVRRYHTFKMMVDDPLTTYDKHSNKVDAPLHKWNEWFQEEALVEAYMFNGEKNWEIISNIFKWQFVEVIEISSDHEVAYSSDASEEVTSPMPSKSRDGKPPIKKLKFDECTVSDKWSTNI